MQSKRWDADLVARARSRGDEKLRGRNVEEYGGVKGSFACVQAASPHAQPLLCLETSFFPFPPLTTPYQVEGSIFTPSPKGIHKKSREFIFLFFYTASFYTPHLPFHKQTTCFSKPDDKGQCINGLKHTRLIVKLNVPLWNITWPLYSAPLLFNQFWKDVARFSERRAR